MTLAILAEYEKARETHEKLLPRAKDAGSSDPGIRREGEIAARKAGEALDRMRALEEAHPGIEGALKRAQQAVSGAQPAAKKPAWTGMLDQMLQNAVAAGAAKVTAEVAAPHRCDPLERGAYRLVLHESADPSLLCFEVVMRRADARSKVCRRDVLADVDETISDL
jgi:hypothetical protein